MKVLDYIVEHSGMEINPMLISLTDFSENMEIRGIIDQDMQANKAQKIQTVAETIFPYSLYQSCNWDRHGLYAQYMKQYPRIQALHRSNANGTYFQRLIAYSHSGGVVNQLENIINSIIDPKVNRRTKYQASIFDVSQDHKEGPYQNFPCLQHITFYKSESGGLVLNAFYAMQYFYLKAYGNWLGLIKLGQFVSEHTGLEFERMNCYIGVEKLDRLTKAKAKVLISKVAEIHGA